jgi:predicted enzyme related to lactoylglutathione lyase
MVARDTPWPAGTPAWVDVTVDDVPTAISFYRAMFGWDIEPGPPETGGYAICHKNGQIVAGLSPKFGPGETSTVWTTYLAADDTAAVAARITAAGGQLLLEPVDVMDSGRMALAADTTGAVFGLCKAGRPAGSAWLTRPAR